MAGEKLNFKPLHKGQILKQANKAKTYGDTGNIFKSKGRIFWKDFDYKAKAKKRVVTAPSLKFSAPLMDMKTGKTYADIPKFQIDLEANWFEDGTNDVRYMGDIEMYVRCDFVNMYDFWLDANYWFTKFIVTQGKGCEAQGFINLAFAGKKNCPIVPSTALIALTIRDDKAKFKLAKKF